MTAKPLNDTQVTKEEPSKRTRRHWYDHEKLNIINKFDKGELEAPYSKPGHVIDPKSKDELSIQLIESWRDAFRTMGILKRRAMAAEQAAQEATAEPQVKVSMPSPRVQREVSSFATTTTGSIQDLLINVLLENQRLKKTIEAQSNGKLTEANF